MGDRPWHVVGRPMRPDEIIESVLVAAAIFDEIHPPISAALMYVFSDPDPLSKQTSYAKRVISLVTTAGKLDSVIDAAKRRGDPASDKVMWSLRRWLCDGCEDQGLFDVLAVPKKKE